MTYSLKHIFLLWLKKARQTWNILLRAFKGVNNKILISLYKIYDRSIMDYASIIYLPYFMFLIGFIKNVHRNFPKHLAGLSKLSYVELLNVCNSEPLQLRRIRMDMLFAYKLLRGNTRGNLFKLNNKHAKLIILQKNFVLRCINNWNSLSSNIICASS